MGSENNIYFIKEFAISRYCEFELNDSVTLNCYDEIGEAIGMVTGQHRVVGFAGIRYIEPISKRYSDITSVRYIGYAGRFITSMDVHRNGELTPVFPDKLYLWVEELPK